MNISKLRFQFIKLARLIIKNITPPILITVLNKAFINQTLSFKSYLTWDEAVKASQSYDSELVIEKVRKAAKLVFDGQAVYERDSVLFDKIQYSFPLLASLLFAAANSQLLRVVDFGGALGTTYQQNRRFLSKLRIICKWRVVEQDKFVQIGRRDFTNDNLSFYNTIDDASKDGVDVVLFGSSICYVPDPYIFIQKAKATRAPFIIFDRTPITENDQDTFAVQTVPPAIYKASYPIRNFSYFNIINCFIDEYELIEDWLCDLQADPNTTSMGFIFMRKEK